MQGSGRRAQVGGRPGDPRHIQAQLFRWRKLFWLGVAVVVLLAGDTAMRAFGPPAFLTAVVRSLISGDTPVIATGASFSVSAGSFATRGRAAAFGAALDASGLPILMRARPDDGRYQVLVGPYVSTDEAEKAQRALASWGLGEARLVVDDTMRGTPQRASVFGFGDSGADSNAVLIIAAAGMSSVVFEMHSAPREVETRRGSATTLDIDIGRVTSAGPMTRLSMPEGVVLARELSVEALGTDSATGGGASSAMRAHLVVADGVRSRVRLEGRRVYVDLAWPQPPWQVGSRTLPLTQRAQAAAPVAARDEVSDASEAYLQKSRAASARFEQMQPFLLSAVESPEPDVLSALAHSLDSIRDSLVSAVAPPALEAKRQSMLSSLALASRAMTPSFAGDRESAIRQAIATFEDAGK